MRVLIAILAAVFLAGGVLLSLFVNAAWFSIPEAGSSISIDVREGDTPAVIAKTLQDAGLLRSLSGYELFASLYAPAAKPKAGSYSFRKGTSYKTFADAIAQGPKREEVSIQVIEGKTIDDEAKLLRSEGIDAEDVYALAGQSRNARPFDPSLLKEFEFLDEIPKEQSLEGYLFPDTYRVWKDQLPEALLRKQLTTFADKVIIPLEADRKASGLSWHEVVTLASIVEAEVQQPKDRAIVAGIFLKRMKNSMRLQSDATLNYILGSGRSRATSEDLATDSAYNSYRNDGLPPGPINNPGLSAIQAVLHPTATDFYFFLTDRNGEVHYAKTFDEHIANRSKL